MTKQTKKKKLLEKALNYCVNNCNVYSPGRNCQYCKVGSEVSLEAIKYARVNFDNFPQAGTVLSIAIGLRENSKSTSVDRETNIKNMRSLANYLATSPEQLETLERIEKDVVPITLEEQPQLNLNEIPFSHSSRVRERIIKSGIELF
jgi:hypothetical protein